MRRDGEVVACGLIKLEGDALALHYAHLLEALGRVEEGKEASLVQTIFRKAQNKVSQPGLLKDLINLIDGENWNELDADVKGDIYEGLLQKNAEDVRGGAGQYFTPRALIRAMMRAVDPKLGRTVHDPACGTGGFLLVAYQYLKGKARKASAEEIEAFTSAPAFVSATLSKSRVSASSSTTSAP